MDPALHSMQLLQVWVLHALAIFIAGQVPVYVEDGAESSDHSWSALREQQETRHADAWEELKWNLGLIVSTNILAKMFVER